MVGGQVVMESVSSRIRDLEVARWEVDVESTVPEKACSNHASSIRTDSSRTLAFYSLNDKKRHDPFLS